MKGMVSSDTLKTLVQGTLGIGVWWIEFMPDFLKYVTAILVIIHLLIKIRNDIK
jgi:hypothetical protein|tara:strand:+ start:313 stop:474 length:162 start_codon:yes stop_codon:yes gene_type:complete